MRNSKLKKFVAIILIASMIFTTGGFATLADSIPDIVGADTIRPTDGANDDTVGADTIRPTDGANDDAVGADIIRPTDGANDDTIGADTIRSNDGVNNDTVVADIIRPINGVDLLSTKSDIDDEIEEETVTDYAEEPEGDIINLVVEAESDIVGSNDDTNVANDNTDGAKSDIVGADTIRPNDDANDNTNVANDNINGTNDNTVGADTIRPTDDANDNTDGVNDNTDGVNDNTDGVNDNTDGVNDNTDGANADTVGADIIRPTDGDNQQNNDDNKYNISTNSNAEEILNSDENVTSIENTKLDINNINLATISEVLENINVASESQIDLEVVSNENIATTSTLNLATFSELSSNNLLSENIASNSEINIASNSEINIASISNIIIEQNIASLSEIKNIASSSQLLGEGGNNLPWEFYFGTYPQNDGSGIQYEPIEWTVLNQDGNEAIVYTSKVIGGSAYGTSGVTWEASYARAYLQNEFLSKAFTTNQIDKCIIEKTLQTGNEVTKDKAFLMMPEDVGKLVYSKKYVYPTEYAKSQGAEPPMPRLSRYVDWWVRKPILYFDGIWGEVWNRTAQTRLYVKGIRPMICLNTSLPVFESSHKISFDLSVASWKSQSTLWRSFNSYYGGQKLPTVANLSLPEEVDFVGWSKDGTVDNLMTEIPLDCKEELSLKAILKSKIVWDLSDGTTGRSGSWDGEAGATHYYIGKTYVLPTNVNPILISEEETYKFFDHWEIDGNIVDSIPAGTKGIITVKAVYRELPSSIWYGTYPQNDISGIELEPIKWRVLKQDGKGALLIADKILDHRGFNNENVATIWRDSNIRTWLNDTFINKAFTINQINNHIIKKNLNTPTLSGNVETEDKVFLLTNDDMYDSTMAFGGVTEKLGKGTEYAQTVTWNGANIPIGYGHSSHWWLRSQKADGIEANQADLVKQNVPNVEGDYVNTGAGIRPSMYIDLSNGKFRGMANKLTWDLGGARFKATSILWNDYNLYQPGQKLPTEENMVMPEGFKFVGFKNIDDQKMITEIPDDAIGDITLQLVYNGIITWNLADEDTGNVGQWDGEAGPELLDPEKGIKTLPTNIIAPPHKVFDHWEIDGKKVTSIEPGINKALEIRAVYRGATYKITWDLYDDETKDRGYAYGDTPTSYEYGVGVQSFPTKVDGPIGKSFDHWEIGGVATTSISTKDFGDKTVKAIYKLIKHEYVWLGVYPQNDKDGQQLEPIKWRVINKTSDEILLLSEYIIDRNVHQSVEKSQYEWKKSIIRNWLNHTFLEKAFSSSQIRDIIVKNTEPEQQDVEDRIYLFTMEEIEYMQRNDLNAVSTKYASRNDEYDNAWWLRFTFSNMYGYVNSTSTMELSVANVPYGIRPALSINLKDTSIYRDNDNSITFDLSGGSWKEGSVLWGEMDTYFGGQILPTADNIDAPNGKEFQGFVINGTKEIITEIPYTQKGDIELVAIYGKQYNITWDLKDGNTSNEGLWDGAAGPSTYYSGLGLSSLPTNVIGPTGRDFDHWEINGVRVTNISSTDSGNKTIKAVYKNKSYEIHWSLSGGSFENNYTAPTSYEYGVGLDLTEARNKYMPQTGKKLNRWLLQFEGETTTTPATSISRTANKKVTVIAECTNASYNITYVDENGNNITWDGTTGPSTYTYGTGITYIPTNINPPEHKEFDHWEIEGVRVDSIGSTETGNKTVVAKYRNKKYKITWQLDQTFPLYDPSIDDDIDITIYGDWENEPGADSYTYGEGYVLPATTSVVPTPGFIVDGWSIEDSTEPMSTEISDVDFGDKVVQVIYRTETYNVTWNLNGAVLTNDADVSPMHPYVYTYGDVHAMSWGLIDASDINNYDSIPAGKVPSHWVVNGVRSDSIPQGSRGDITITLVYTDTPSHNIAWDYGTGENHWSFDGWVAPATYSEGVAVVFPDKSFVSAPDGKELDYFTVDGVQATEIPATSITDVTVAAVLKNKSYRIKYNLGDGSWDGVAGAGTYTNGTSYTLPTNIVGGRGQEFDHWEIGGVATTGISASDFGHKEFTAVYRNKTYNITWDLKGATINTEIPSTYTYGTEVVLPSENDIIGHEGRVFAYWTVNGVIMTSIPNTHIGDVTVAINYATYTITWKLGEGQFNNYTPPMYYDGGVTLKLPDSSKIIPPTDYVFDYFKVNNVRATEIVAGLVGDVVVEAVYKSKAEPATESDTKFVLKISVKTKPNKTSYKVGDKFDPTGLVISVMYSDNTIIDLEYNDTTKNDIIISPDKDYVLSKFDTEVFVIYKNSATTFNIDMNAKIKPEPSPYIPGGGGGSSGGGGGGSGGRISGLTTDNQVIPQVTYIDQIKFIKEAVDGNRIVWNYDPIINKFKMNIAIGEQFAPAINGFYLINSIKEQEVNGVNIYIPETATYYFDKEGNMITGWVNTTDNKWYYLETVKTEREGMMVFGWYKVQDKWYYFMPDGSMLANSLTPDGYFVGADGAWVQ